MITWTWVVLLAILFFTAIAAILANLGLFGLNPDSTFAKTTLGAVLLEIIGAVLLVWKTGVLNLGTVSASIIFPNNTDPGQVSLDADRCRFEVRNLKAEITASGTLPVVWGQSGCWECRFPTPKDLDESVVLRLRERTGKEWEVRPFYPLSRNVEALPIESEME